VGGNVVHFVDMARHLKRAGWPVWGLQAQGVDGRHPLHRSVEEMARHYLGEMRELQPSGPYFLGGSSFGGVVAWEVAQQLHRAGEEVAVLAMFDTWGPGYPTRLPSSSRLRGRADELRYRVALHVNSYRQSEPGERVEWFRRRATTVGRRTAGRVRARVERAQVPAHLREIERAGLKADEQYEPRPFAGRAILFRATEQPPGIRDDPTNGWDGYALGGLDIHHVPGFHGAFMEEPGVRELAPVLLECLEAAWRERR
jgi:thioesterase domain-containing protein